MRPIVAKISARLAPIVAPGVILFAVVFACILPSDKAIRAHVDENGMTSEGVGTLAVPGALQTFVPPPESGPFCFTETRIVGRRSPVHDAFYIVANADHVASMNAVRQASVHWYAQRTRLATTIVVLLAANASCLETVGAAVDPSFRVKAAVIVNTTNTVSDRLCVDTLAGWGTQPNHDFPLVGVMTGLAHFTCPRSYDSESLSLVGDAVLSVAHAAGRSSLAASRVKVYLAELRAMVAAFTTGRDPRPTTGPRHLLPLSAFRLGVPGYPPVFSIVDAFPGSAATAGDLERSTHGALVLDKLVWSMNAMNERLHHSFAVWFPLEHIYFIENNAAQLQALLVLGGVLALAYSHWTGYVLPARGRFARGVRLPKRPSSSSAAADGPPSRDTPAAATWRTVADGALVAAVTAGGAAAAHFAAVPLLAVAAVAHVVGVACAVAPWPIGAPGRGDAGAAVTAIGYVLFGMFVFSLSAVNSATATAVAIAGGLAVIDSVVASPKARRLLAALEAVAAAAAFVVLDAFLADSVSAAVAGAMAVASLVSATRLVRNVSAVP